MFKAGCNMPVRYCALMGLAALLVCASIAIADERGDSVLEQVEEASNAILALPVLIDYTITYTYKGNTWTNECRTVRSGNSTSSSTKGSFAQGNTIPPDQLPRPAYAFEPLLVSPGLPFDEGRVTTRYLGVVTEGGALYKVMQITFPLSVRFLRHAPLSRKGPSGTRELVSAKWYIGIDEMIHRMSGDITILPEDAAQEAQVVHVEARVTAIRKPKATPVDPNGKAQPVRTLQGIAGAVWTAAFAPNGKRLAFGCYEGTVQLWDTATWDPLPLGPKHHDPIQRVAFSPDSRLLAAASFDKTVTLIDVTTGQVVRTLNHPDVVDTVAFSPDGRLLATAGADKTIRIWDTATGKALHTLQGHAGSINAVAFSPNGRLLASCGWDNTARLWNTSTWQEAHTLAGHSEPVFCLAFSPDGRRLATGSRDGLVKIWDTATGRNARTLQAEMGPVLTILFTPDGKTLLAGFDDKYKQEGSHHPGVKFWNTTTWRVWRTLTADSLAVTCLALTPDGHTLLTAGWSSNAQMFAMPSAH